MTAFTDRLDELLVTATSPDGGIVGQTRYQGSVIIGFRSRTAYARYDERDLSIQLTAILNRLGKLRSDAIQLAKESTGRRRLHYGSGPHPDAQRRRYRAEADNIEAVGISPRSAIIVGAVGMTSHTVKVQPNALKDLDVIAFASEFEAAYRSCRNEHANQVYQLKLAHFPP